MNAPDALRPAPAAQDAAGDAVLRRVRDEGIEQVRVVWADLHGSYRSKTLVCDADAAALRSAFDDGVGMVATLLLKDSADRTALPVFDADAMRALPGFGGAGNLLMRPDPQRFVVLPWAPKTAWLMAEPHGADGTPVDADPRRVLQRALGRLADAGLGLRCGLELEFHIHRIVDAGGDPDAAAWPAEAPTVELLHPGFALLSDAAADACEAPLAIVRQTALGLGLPLRSLEIEFGPSQFEAVFAPTDALQAADQMLMFRNGVRQALRRAGYHASFACRPPFAQAVASGWHLHQSLCDAEGRPVMACATPAADPRAARHVLSPRGAHWLAGLQAHAAAMAALCVPTVAGYGRFHGSVMAPAAAVWGFDHRGAMLRVLGGPGSASTRIENRLPEPMANPYLAIASQVAAGLDGLQRRLDPGPGITERAVADRPPLPADLAQALRALAGDAVMQAMLGDSLAAVHATVRQQELTRHAEAEDQRQWLRREHFARF